MKSLRQQQAAQTRATIIAVARAQLQQRGYEATRVEDIADGAGVAVPTVYKAFSSKRRLLGVVIETAMADSLDGTIANQPWWQEQIAEPDPVRQLELIARNARRIYERAGRLLQLLQIVASDDPEMAALARRIDDERRHRSIASARALEGKAALRTSVRPQDAVATLWALTSPELYLLQLGGGSMTADDYERWLASVLRHALLVD